MANVLHISLNVRRETKDRLLRLQTLLGMLENGKKILLNDAIEFALGAAERELADRKARALADLFSA